MRLRYTWITAISGAVLMCAVLCYVAFPPTWSVEKTPSIGKVVAFQGISCPTSTVCWMVGDANGIPVIEERDIAKWTVVRTPHLSNLSNASLMGVSCVSAVACTAVGYTLVQHDSFGSTTQASMPIVATLAGDSWTYTIPSFPTQGVELNDVSCATVTHCVAVGETQTATPSAIASPILVELSRKDNHWHQESVPARVLRFGGAFCALAGQCFVDMSAHNGTDTGVGLMSEQANGWKSSYVGSTPEGLLTVGGISCIDGRCVIPASSGIGPIVATYTKHTWTLDNVTSIFSQFPPEAGVYSNTNVNLPAVACVSVDQCVVAGSCIDTYGNQAPLVLASSYAAWERPFNFLEQGHTAPSCSPTNPSLQYSPTLPGEHVGNLLAAACTADGQCWAVGYQQQNTADYGAPLVLHAALPAYSWYWSVLFLVGFLVCIIGFGGVIRDRRLVNAKRTPWDKSVIVEDRAGNSSVSVTP